MLIGAYMNASGNWVFNGNVDVQSTFNMSAQPYLTMSASPFQTYTNNANTDFAGWNTTIDKQGGMYKWYNIYYTRSWCLSNCCRYEF